MFPSEPPALSDRSSPRRSARSRRKRAAVVPLGAFALVCGLAVPLAAASPAPAEAAIPRETTAANVEEARLTAVVPGGSVPSSQQFIESSGLRPVLAAFDERLSTASSAAAPQIVAEAGAQLWTRAVATARGDNAAASGDRYDDRGLYWARLAARMSIKSWVAADPARGALLADLLQALERSSRGFDDVAHTDTPGTRRILTTGFDPFQLDEVGQRSNPSGSAALVLDGTTIDTPTGPAVVQAVVLPVTWSAFDTGIVEDVYGPGLRYGARSIDMLVTISQGRPDGFDIEGFAGVWRGGFDDNLTEGVAQGYRQEVPAAPAALGWPQPETSPQFIETTLPWEAIVNATTGPAPVRLNKRICISPTAVREPAATRCGAVSAIKPEWFAVEGGGGDYLSNESMYRANRLRLEMGRTDVAGGHLHTKSLGYESIPAGQVTSATFESARAAVVDQTVAIFGAAAEALRPPVTAHATVTPAEASAGESVSITIEGLLPREPFVVEPPVGPSQTVVAGEDGSAAVTWTVPQDASAGPHTLTFVRQDGSSVSSSVVVRAAETTPTATPTASASPASPAPAAGTIANGSGSAAGDRSARDAARHSSPQSALAQTGASDASLPLVLAAVATLSGVMLTLRRRRSTAAGRRN